MKTKLVLTTLLSFYFCLLSSQVPQGFNYQAIARDGSGNPITNQSLQVKLAVMGDSLGASIYWEELFNPVTTNAFGLFTVPLGKGARQATSTVLTFSNINWNVTPIFMRTQIYYLAVWKNMGSTRFWSVPYALLANTAIKANALGGSLPWLGVSGNTTVMDSALFVVRNNKGQIVFAVYNEGVRIYVDDGIAKGSNKGGFAIGGFDKTKGTVQNYLVVRPDTFRIYFDDSPGKGTKGGFAIGGFNTAKGAGAEYLGVKGTTPEIINPSQPRVLWYPLKEAFLTGRVLVVSPDSIGLNSFATGYESKAKGSWSQALGYQTIAKGEYSTSIGKNSASLGLSSFAFGDHARSTGAGAYALGTYATASGDKSFALGSVGIDSAGNTTGKTIASGYGAFAAGFGSVSSGDGAFTFGVADTASAPFATAMGYETVANGWFCTSMGLFTKSGGGMASTATGWGSQVLYNGFAGMANGCNTTSSNWVAAAFGDRTTASGHTSFATGYKTTASGHLSSTFGDNTIATGDGATVMGHYSTAQAFGSLVIGRYNTIAGNTSTWNFWDPLFVAGNGTSTSDRSNAMTVYNSGIADLGWYINLLAKAPAGQYQAIKVNDIEALWYNGTYFSWGYGASYNYFRGPLTIGNAASPSYTLNVAGTTNSSGGYFQVSDSRWKTNLQPVEDVLGKIIQMKSYRFNWRTKDFPEMNFDNTDQIGLIAQDVEKAFPELVRTDNKGYKSVSYDKLSVLLIQGMKEQQKQIDSQKQENIQLRSELNSLKEEIEKIKSSTGNR